MEFDDAFDDDELDSLTEAALRELEQKTLQATQAQAQARLAAAAATSHGPPSTPAPAPAPAPPVPAVVRQPPFRPPRPIVAQQNAAAVAQPLKPSIRPQGSQLGRVQATQFRPQNSQSRPQNTQFRPPGSQLRPQNSQFHPHPTPYNRPPASQFHPQSTPYSRPPDSTKVHAPFVPPARTSPGPLPVRPASQNTSAAADDASTLQTRIAELTQQLTSSRGETSILRSHLDRLARDHAAHMAATRARYDSQLADFKASLEGAQTAERRVRTELAFLQQEARERSVARAASSSTAAAAAKKAPSTPKKSVKTWDLADGFGGADDSWSPRRRKERGTPKGKRKRDISMGQLDVGPDVGPEPEPETAVGPADKQKVDQPVGRAPTPSIDFLRLLLDHQSAPHSSTFDTLSQYTLSSLVSETPDSPRPWSLATSLLHALPAMGPATHPLQLLADFSSHILALMAGCIAEDVAAALAPLADLLGFTLRLHTWSILPGLLPRLVPTLTAALTYTLSQRNPSTAAAAATPLASLLYFCALGCSASPDPTPAAGSLRRLFWSHMTRDVVSLCLSRHAPPAAAIAMLDMLRTSAHDTSIGPVSETMPADAVARFLLERISRLLTAPTTDNTDAAAADDDDIHSVRAVQRAALRSLCALAAQSALARQTMAGDGVLLARVAEAVAAGVDALYTVSGRSACVVAGRTTAGPLACGPVAGFGGADVGEWSCMVGLGVELLHVLVAGDGAMQSAARGRLLSELGQQHRDGGVERLVVGLSRVNFADEDGLFEAWLDAETGERAMQVLDVLVTADEGGAIAEAFVG